MWEFPVLQTSLRRFVESVRRSDPAHAVLANWGLELESETVDLQVNKIIIREITLILLLKK